ncbi:MAG: Coenzyme F420 hydrogenase/dehydrogenase, beta subunit C-terminal domain [Desulfobacterales bacterium]|nr:Coenzyme F420 hydrogenase/dehydrogenase, beta subunit C-terminal domain [Desulfobacterales bacterium]
MMKTFSDLVEDVQKTGLCQRCGACVAFCTAINYGALELDEEGKPRYKADGKCIEGGLCYSICPETHELDEEVKNLVAWEPPMGRVLDAAVARAINPDIQKKATDGGVVTALLLHLFEKGHIDGAIVTKKTGLFQRKPWLATTREEIIESAGFHFDASHGLNLFSEVYSTYSPTVVKVGYTGAKRLDRVAFVGTPCQANAIRRLQAMGIEPSGAITIILGLFCTGNFIFGPEQQRRLEEIGRFQWNKVDKINVKDQLLIHFYNKETRHISLDQLDFMKRHACQYCFDYSAEFADLSFGGLGSPEGWTTVITRSPLGRTLLAEALGAVEIYSHKINPLLAYEVLEKTMELSNKKKQSAKKNRIRDGKIPETIKV